VTERMRELGAEILPMAFVPEGMQSWSWADRSRVRSTPATPD
jgi:hypothetical protein